MLCWQQSWGFNIIDKRGLNITHSTVKVKAPLTQFRADNMQEQWAKPQSLFHDYRPGQGTNQLSLL